MKKLLLLLFLYPVLNISAQTKTDSIKQVRDIANWYDLNFTDAEADSMLGDMKDYKNVYQGMHRTYPKNDLPFPFAWLTGIL